MIGRGQGGFMSLDVADGLDMFGVFLELASTHEMPDDM